LLGRVAWLSLDGNGITDAGARVLARSPYLEKLTWLALRQNEIGDAVRQELIERFGGGVVRF
jgi:hypothetical protein